MLAPQNTVHVIGQATPPLYFNCSIEFATPDTFTWLVFANRPPAGVTVAWNTHDGPTVVRPPFRSEYDVEGDNLIVKDADFDDAGAYRCESTSNPITEKTAEAIVLGEFIIL